MKNFSLIFLIISFANINSADVKQPDMFYKTLEEAFGSFDDRYAKNEQLPWFEHTKRTYFYLKQSNELQTKQSMLNFLLPVLITAIDKDGNDLVDAILKFLQNEIDQKAFQEYCTQFLIRACLNGKLNIVNLMIANGVRPACIAFNDLIDIASRGNVEIVRQLLLNDCSFYIVTGHQDDVLIHHFYDYIQDEAIQYKMRGLTYEVKYQGSIWNHCVIL